MRGKVVLDEKGKIVSISYMPLVTKEFDEDSPTLNYGPVVEKGQTLVELDLSKYIKKPDVELISHLERDIKAKKKTARKE